MKSEHEQSNVAIDEQLQLVSFVVNDELFAVDVLSVQEINRMMELTRIPQPPHGVEGVINLRGRIIPVLHLSTQFGMQRTERSEQTRIIVMEIQGKTIGLIVDEVREVIRIPESIVSAPPQMNSSIDASFVTGVAKLEDQLLILLDLDNLLSTDSINEIDQARTAA